MESAGLHYAVDSNGLPSEVDLTPSASGSAYTDVDELIADGWFESVNYKGAVGSVNWLEGWSGLDVLGMLTEDLSIESDNPVLADQISLNGNYPNPFNPETEISFHLGKNYETVTLTIYSLTGRLVYEASYQKMNAGSHKISWNSSNMNGELVPSGLYLYRVSTETQSVMGKMTLLK